MVAGKEPFQDKLPGDGGGGPGVEDITIDWTVRTAWLVAAGPALAVHPRGDRGRAGDFTAVIVK